MKCDLRSWHATQSGAHTIARSWFHRKLTRKFCNAYDRTKMLSWLRLAQRERPQNSINASISNTGAWLEYEEIVGDLDYSAPVADRPPSPISYSEVRLTAATFQGPITHTSESTVISTSAAIVASVTWPVVLDNFWGPELSSAAFHRILTTGNCVFSV